MSMPPVPPPYDEILRPKDSGIFRDVVSVHFPQVPFEDPALAEFWPYFDEAHRRAIQTQAGFSEREQFTAGFGFGVVAAAAIGYFLFLRERSQERRFDAGV
jgi:hypothetical protein